MKLPKTTILATGLFISLIANLLLGGMIMGRQYAGRGIGDPQSFKPIYKVMKDLTPAQRQQVKEISEPAQAALKEKYRELRVVREQIRDLLLADKVDRRALNQAYGDYRRVNGDVQDTMHEVMVKVATLLPLEQREKMLDEGRPDAREKETAAKDAKEAKPAKDAKEARDTRGAKEIKEVKGTTEVKEPKEAAKPVASPKEAVAKEPVRESAPSSGKSEPSSDAIIEEEEEE